MLEFSQLCDPLLHHPAVGFHLPRGVTGRAECVANLLRRQLCQQVPHPSHISDGNVMAEPTSPSRRVISGTSMKDVELRRRRAR